MWRLIVAIILFLVSLLALVKAPTNLFWLVAVAVTEFPYIPVLVSIVFFVACINTQHYKMPVLMVTGAAVIIESGETRASLSRPFGGKTSWSTSRPA